MLYLNEGRPSDASRVLAATGWDAEAQHPGAATRRAATGVTKRERTILAEALRHLASIQGSEYDAARAEGRTAGLFATARAFLADPTAP